MESSIDIIITEMNRADLIQVEGRVDSSNADKLQVALDQQIDKGAVNIVVDLEKVDYMSSAGLRTLVSALKRVKRDGGDLRICSPSERVQEVFELAGLTSIFDVFDDQVTAVGSF
jgi:anti-sigma B factor antagonist